jgi:hypothetical protein
MYSKADAQLIKKEFWSTFGNVYPRKWLLYNTKIKDVTFKFNVDNKKAYVMLDIEPKDENKRKIYFEKVESLKEILIEEFLSDVIFDREHYLESGKIISRVWVELSDVSLNRKSDWETIFNFFYDKMDAFERFFYENEDYIKDLEVNT